MCFKLAFLSLIPSVLNTAILALEPRVTTTSSPTLRAAALGVLTRMGLTTEKAAASTLSEPRGSLTHALQAAQRGSLLGAVSTALP